MAQVGNRLEQGRDDQVQPRLRVAQRAAHQAAFFLQQQHLQQVADGFGVADDVVLQGLRAVASTGLGGGLENGQFLEGQLAVGGAGHAQGARLAQQAQQHGLAAVFVQRGVVFQASMLQQLGHHQLVLVGALPQIQRGQMKAEYLHGPHQWPHMQVGQRGGVVAAQRLVHGAQIGQEGLGIRVGGRRGHGVPQGLLARQLPQRGGQPGIHAGQGAAIGLIGAVRVVVGRALGQGLHLGRHAHQQPRHRQLGAQLVHLQQVVAQGHLGLSAQGQAQGLGRHEGVAIAVATNPVAHAQEGGDVQSGQRGLQLRIQLGDLRQEGAGVVAQHVLDLVGHRQLGVAQHARLPQLGDAGAQGQVDLGQAAIVILQGGLVAL